MIEKIFKNEWDKLVAKELSQKVASIALSVALAILAFTTYKLVTEQKTIILPTNINNEFWATSNYVSESYLKDMGQYISTATLNVAPNSAKEQFELVLNLASPNYYQTLKGELLSQERYIKENGITSIFFTKSFKFEKDHIAVSGTKRHIITDRVVETKEVVFKIFFEIQNGRFYISGLDIK